MTCCCKRRKNTWNIEDSIVIHLSYLYTGILLNLYITHWKT